MKVELARILDSLPATVWTALRDGNVNFINRKRLEVLGQPPDEASAWGCRLSSLTGDRSLRRSNAGKSRHAHS